jgi:uncharacterized protein YoxC
MESEAVEVLKEIKDQLTGVNDQLTGMNGQLTGVNGQLTGILDEVKGVREEVKGTNTRLDRVEGRLQFVEKRLTNGFADLSQKIDNLAREQQAGFVSIEGVLGRVHAAIVNNVAVLDHERRLADLEKPRR